MLYIQTLIKSRAFSMLTKPEEERVEQFFFSTKNDLVLFLYVNIMFTTLICEILFENVL